MNMNLTVLVASLLIALSLADEECSPGKMIQLIQPPIAETEKIALALTPPAFDTQGLSYNAATAPFLPAVVANPAYEEGPPLPVALSQIVAEPAAPITTECAEPQPHVKLQMPISAPGFARRASPPVAEAVPVQMPQYAVPPVQRGSYTAHGVKAVPTGQAFTRRMKKVPVDISLFVRVPENASSKDIASINSDGVIENIAPTLSTGDYKVLLSKPSNNQRPINQQRPVILTRASSNVQGVIPNNIVPIANNVNNVANPSNLNSNTNSNNINSNTNSNNNVNNNNVNRNTEVKSNVNNNNLIANSNTDIKNTVNNNANFKSNNDVTNNVNVNNNDVKNNVNNNVNIKSNTDVRNNVVNSNAHESVTNSNNVNNNNDVKNTANVNSNTNEFISSNSINSDIKNTVNVNNAVSNNVAGNNAIGNVHNDVNINNSVDNGAGNTSVGNSNSVSHHSFNNVVNSASSSQVQAGGNPSTISKKLQPNSIHSTTRDIINMKQESTKNTPEDQSTISSQGQTTISSQGQRTISSQPSHTNMLSDQILPTFVGSDSTTQRQSSSISQN